MPDNFTPGMHRQDWLYRFAKFIERRLPPSFVSFGTTLWEYWDGFSNYMAMLVGKIPSRHLRVLLYKLFGIQIGRSSVIGLNARFFNTHGIHIGDNSTFGSGAMLDGRKGLFVGNHCCSGMDVAIFTLQHDMDSPTFETVGGPVIIGDYVYIGPRVIILPGVNIGKGAVVMAGAVVTKDVAPYHIVGGIPARFIRERSHDQVYHVTYSPFR